MACGADLVQAGNDEQLLLFIQLVQVLCAALLGKLHVRHSPQKGDAPLMTVQNATRVEIM